MRNILIFSRTLLIGGAEKQAILLTKLLKDIYPTQLVVLHKLIDQKHQDLLEEYDIDVTFLEGNVLQKVITLIGILRQARIDVIFCYLASNNLYGAIAGKLSGVPNIIGGIRSSVIPIHKFILQRLFHNYVFRYTIFNNHAGKKALVQRGFKKAISYVIPNCIEIKSSLIHRKKKRVVKVVSVSRFVPVKDYYTSLKALDFLLSITNSEVIVRYDIIGYGELENEIQSWVSELGLEEHVKLVLNPENLNDFYERSDIYLSTSIREGMSNSIMEAMGYSLPVVATDVGDNKYLVEEGVNGYLCEVGNYKQIAFRLNELIRNHKLRSEMGTRSYERIKSHYSMDAFQRSYREFIDRL